MIMIAIAKRVMMAIDVVIVDIKEIKIKVIIGAYIDRTIVVSNYISAGKSKCK